MAALPGTGHGSASRHVPRRGRSPGLPKDSTHASCRTRQIELKPELWKAAEEGDAARIRDILARTPAGLPKPVDVKFQGWTPLMKASENGCIPAMHLLLGARASVRETNKRGRTALSFAVAPSTSNGGAPAQEDAYALLLRAGANPGHKDSRGTSPRSHLALRKMITAGH